MLVNCWLVKMVSANGNRSVVKLIYSKQSCSPFIAFATVGERPNKGEKLNI